jgi:hypothetical protein
MALWWQRRYYMKSVQICFVALVVTVVLALVAPVVAGAQEIPPGPSTSLPDYIGAPAKAHPTENSSVPKNPFLAPNSFSDSHSDSWRSDTTNVAGPLGRNPEVFSSTLAEAHQYPDWLLSCENVAFDSHGRPIVACAGLKEASVIMLDPDTLEVLTYYPLVVKKTGYAGEGEQQIPLPIWSIYSYLDNRDQINIVSGNNTILVLREAGSPSSPFFEKVAEYSLSGLKIGENNIDGDKQRITGLQVDFQGRYWLNMGTSAYIWVLNPATAKYPITDLPHVNLGNDEVTRNAMALTKEGAAYIVTTKKMYRVDAGADDQPYVVWSVPYDTIGEVRKGQYELGTGTTPTILGEGKYVAITDNAEQLNVVVYRTEAGLAPDQQVVCKLPVFDFPGGGKGANSNSLIGLHNSMIIQNTYGYLFDWDSGKLMNPGSPGMERIDIDPNGKGCTKVWVNTDVVSNLLVKVSTRTGLIYTQERKYDAEKDLYAVYWVALDFRTGKVVWEKLAGTFYSWYYAMFDNFWAGISIGPNGALYAGQYAGITMIRDAH